MGQSWLYTLPIQVHPWRLILSALKWFLACSRFDFFASLETHASGASWPREGPLQFLLPTLQGRIDLRQKQRPSSYRRLQPSQASFADYAFHPFASWLAFLYHWVCAQKMRAKRRKLYHLRMCCALDRPNSLCQARQAACYAYKRVVPAYMAAFHLFSWEVSSSAWQVSTWERKPSHWTPSASHWCNHSSVPVFFTALQSGAKQMSFRHLVMLCLVSGQACEKERMG